MKIVNCGDSWAWGAELVDTKILPYVGDMVDHNEHYEPEHEKHRLNNRYIKLFADKVGASEIIDLSMCSYSNESIIRTLIRWLAINDYLSGRDTSDLFVSIGFTSPERREHMYSGETTQSIGVDVPGLPEGKRTLEPWILVGPWMLDYKFPGVEERVSDFMRMYVEMFWNVNEYLYRYYSQIIMLQNLLNNNKIKYVMHQAFYHVPNTNPREWSMDRYKKLVMNNIPWYDEKLWDVVDSKKFMLKNNNITPTFKDYITQHVKGNVEFVLYAWHLNDYGHKIWAEYMYEYCCENNLL